MNLEGKRALVTGGAVRLGRAICERLAREGADVVVHYRNSGQQAKDLCKELSSVHGVKTAAIGADLVSERACRALMADADSELGAIDVLVNNAAVFNKHRLADVTEEAVLGEFWPNLFAPMFLMRAFAEQAREGGIVNVLDRRITTLDSSCVPYLLTKHGLATLTRVAALELAPRVTVNGVAPGAILAPPGEGEGYLKEQGGGVPLERQCTPEEVADAVAYLLKSNALTGQIIYVDGGQHLLGRME